MKNEKKYPKEQLEKYSTVFMQLSLVLVLFVVYQVLEYESVQKKIELANGNFDFEPIYTFDEAQVIYKKELVEKKVEIKKVKEVQIINVIDIVKNDEVIEKLIEDFPVIDDETNAVDDALMNYIEIDDETRPVDDVPFIQIEDAPVYKGCEGLSKEENKKCFIKSIQKFIIKRFNVDLAQDLGLNSGAHKMFAMFVIDKNGNVVGVKVKAPHVRLKKEVQKIIEKLPKFIPGMQRKVPVNVKFTLPISFRVE
jgi:protein TonB